MKNCITHIKHSFDLLICWGVASVVALCVVTMGVAVAQPTVVTQFMASEYDGVIVVESVGGVQPDKANRQFPQLQCGALHTSELSVQIEEFSQAEVNRVELDNELGSSSIIYVDADAIDFPDRNIVYLSGYTRLTQSGNQVTANELIYDKSEAMVEARGLVQLSSTGGDVVQTSKLFYDIASQTARADGDVRLITVNGDFINAQDLRYDLQEEAIRSGPAEFLFANRDAKSAIYVGEERAINAYGRAGAMEFIGENNVILYQVVVTTCLDGNPDLRFTADSLEVDLLTGNRKGINTRVVVVDPSEYSSYKGLIN